MPFAPRCLGSSYLAVLLAFVTVPQSGFAQMLEAPITVLGGSIGTEQLATGRDGSVLQLGASGGGVLVTRRFPNALPQPSTPIVLTQLGLGTGLTALPHGGYAATWLDSSELPGLGLQFRIVTQRLSPAGVPLGPTVPASDYDFAVDFAGIAPLGDGFVVAYRFSGEILGQRFDVTGTPLGGRFVIAQEEGIANTRMVAVAGGFLVVWGRDGDTNARLYGAAATPLGAPFTVATSFELTGLAVNPAGTLAAIVGVPHDGDPQPNEQRIRFFAPDGSSVGGDLVVGPRALDEKPDVASDRSGNFLVVSGVALRMRAYDSTGTAFGPSATFNNVGQFGDAKVVGRRAGGFFVIRAIYNKTYIASVTLCAPGSAVCGDGTLVPTCEVCDAGAGNSNVTPDACRSDCVPARCGDGAIDSDEECDDGNGINCDGCNELCEVELGTSCGDGVLAPPGCHEACDDANGIGGDGCSTSCEIEHILGGGKVTTDCYAAWRIDNPSNDPRFAKRGGVNPQQRCRDNDPACDFDGGVVGSCTFHLAVCVNNSEPQGCAPDRLQSWTLASPSAKQALTRPVLATVRSALEAAVVPTVVGSGDPDKCSPDADIVLPLRGAPGAFKSSKLKLKARAAIYGGDLDTDGLLLRCDP